MSDEMKPTPGVWKWDSDPIKGDPLGRLRFRVVTTGKTITQCYYSSDDEHAKDDTRLIAEAGTVHHETGLTPRQLVERVKELEKAMGEYMSAFGQALEAHGILFAQQQISADGMARAALSKSLPNTVAKVDR